MSRQVFEQQSTQQPKQQQDEHAPPSRVRQEHEKFCEECGNIVLKKAEICPHCGVRLRKAPYAHDGAYLGKNTENGKNKVVAALLAFFLGWIGAHKFYLGQIGYGILYLIFCWTFIPSIIAFIESIIFLSMDDRTFEEKFGRY